jgi:hypothetical protein
MNEATAVDLTRWLGQPIAATTSALADHHVEVLAQPQDAGPFGPLATLASAAVRVFAGDQVIALVTAGRVAGFAPAPTGAGGLAHRVAALERRVAALEPKQGAAAPQKATPQANKAPVKKAPARRRQS